MIAVQVVLILLATLAVTLRIVSRYVRRRLLRVDDYLIVTGFVSSILIRQNSIIAMFRTLIDAQALWIGCVCLRFVRCVQITTIDVRDN